jgi:hypothetical protein
MRTFFFLTVLLLLFDSINQFEFYFLLVYFSSLCIPGELIMTMSCIVLVVSVHTLFAFLLNRKIWLI